MQGHLRRLCGLERVRANATNDRLEAESKVGRSGVNTYDGRAATHGRVHEFVIDLDLERVVFVSGDERTGKPVVDCGRISFSCLCYSEDGLPRTAFRVTPSGATAPFATLKLYSTVRARTADARSERAAVA